MQKLTPEQEAAIEAMKARRGGGSASSLDAETKARIEAEEAYRAQVRAGQAQKPPTPPQDQTGCASGCGTWLAWGVGILFLLGLLSQCGGGSSSGSSSGDAPVATAEPFDFGDFGVTCRDIVEKRLKAPATAKFSNYYTDEREGRGGGSYSGGFHWHGTVDSENSFGAMLRANFTCSTQPGSDTVTLDSFN